MGGELTPLPNPLSPGAPPPGPQGLPGPVGRDGREGRDGNDRLGGRDGFKGPKPPRQQPGPYKCSLRCAQEKLKLLPRPQHKQNNIHMFSIENTAPSEETNLNMLNKSRSQSPRTKLARFNENADPSDEISMQRLNPSRSQNQKCETSTSTGFPDSTRTNP